MRVVQAGPAEAAAEALSAAVHPKVGVGFDVAANESFVVVAAAAVEDRVADSNPVGVNPVDAKLVGSKPLVGVAVVGAPFDAVPLVAKLFPATPFAAEAFAAAPLVAAPFGAVSFAVVPFVPLLIAANALDTKGVGSNAAALAADIGAGPRVPSGVTEANPLVW